MAAIEFEAVDTTNFRIFKGRWPAEDFVFRSAVAFLAKSKPDLVCAVKNIVEDADMTAFSEYLDALEEAKTCFEDFAKLLGAAHCRLMIAAAVIGFGEDATTG